MKSPKRPKLMIRRGKKIQEGVEVQSVFTDIKSGELKPSHEFSMDGVNWRRLDSHPQLAKVFASLPEPEPKSKGLWVFLVLVFLVLAAGLFFHPYWAFYNVQTAVNSGNIEKFSQGVDFADVRQDVQSQLEAQWNDVSASQISNTPYAKRAGPLARARVNQMVNALVTPEAVMGFAKGKTDMIGSWEQRNPKTPAAGDSQDPLADLGLNMESVTRVLANVQVVLAQAEMGYAGFNSFVVTLKAEGSEGLVFRYQRKGMGWKLSEMTLPSGQVRSALNGIARSALKKARSQAGAVSKSRPDQNKDAGKDKEKVSLEKPVEVAKLTDEKKAYMANMVIKSLTVGKGGKYLYGSPNPGLFATLTNNGNRALDEVEITIYFYNGQGAIVSEKKLYPVSVSKYRPGRDNDPFQPQKSKKIGYLVKDFAPSSWGGKVQVRVTDIQFKK